MERVRALVLALLIILGQAEKEIPQQKETRSSLQALSEVVTDKGNVDAKVDRYRPQLQIALQFLAIHGPVIYQMLQAKGGVSALKDPAVRAEVRQYLMQRVTEWFVGQQAGNFASTLINKLGK